jgi:hypothetical protein
VEDEERAGPAFDKGRERRLEVLDVATFQDNDLPPERSRGRKHVARQFLCRLILLIASKIANRRRLR